jgi:hypothetical protein
MKYCNDAVARYGFMWFERLNNSKSPTNKKQNNLLFVKELSTVLTCE